MAAAVKLMLTVETAAVEELAVLLFFIIVLKKLPVVPLSLAVPVIFHNFFTKFWSILVVHKTLTALLHPWVPIVVFRAF